MHPKILSHAAQISNTNNPLPSGNKTGDPMSLESSQAPASANATSELQPSCAPISKSVLYFCLIVFALGLGLRYMYIFEWHRMDNPEYLFSDMKGYHAVSKNFLDPNYVEGMADTVHPPGTKYFFGTIMALEIWWTQGSAINPPFNLAMAVQFLLSCLIPALLFGIAWDLYGKRTALVVLVGASLYYPLFDYFAYLLSEGPFMFCMVSSIWLLIRGLKNPGALSALYGLFSGIMLGCSGALKSVSLPGALLILIALILMSIKHKKSWRKPIAASLIGFLLILIPLAIRGTRLSNDKVAKEKGEFHICLIANDAARNVLLGHYGDVGSMIWEDKDRYTIYEFGSPSAAQKGLRSKKHWNIGVYENSKLMKEALKWIAAHPAEALLLSFEHFFDLALGTLPWPSSVIHKHWVKAFHYIFLIFILFPALMYITLNAKNLFELKKEQCGDLIIFLPLCGLSFAAFIALGEPRYRIPYDGFIILLAARMYCRAWLGDKNLIDTNTTAPAPLKPGAPATA